MWKLDTAVSFYKKLLPNMKNQGERKGDEFNNDQLSRGKVLPEPGILVSTWPTSKLDAAALKIQKIYRSYRVRRNLADCAVIAEELWSSVSFSNTVGEPESAISRWAWAGTMVAKLGKGLCKDDKAQKLALRHWLEAIDARHRYGHNLHFYYNIWFNSQSSQPFFYWLDIGDGKDVNLEECPRANLQRECIKYLGPKERKAYEVIVDRGKLVYKKTRELLDTPEGSKWIFVLSTSRDFYVGQKQKGHFQHSSFLAGAATIASGRLVAQNGVLQAVWPYSGHYRPTEENFMEFINFLEEHQLDLSNVKKYPVDDDVPPPFVKKNLESYPSQTLPSADDKSRPSKTKIARERDNGDSSAAADSLKAAAPPLPLPSSKWTTGAGPRIGCVREYPTELQFQALEKVNLSPRIVMGTFPCSSSNPIPSPMPSPKLLLSP